MQKQQQQQQKKQYQQQNIQVYTQDQVSQHNSEKDCWIIIDGFIYDLTNFQNLHPAGSKIMQNYFGKDASQIFHYFHNDNISQKFKNLIVGRLQQVPLKIIPIHEFEFSDKKTHGVPYGDSLQVQGWHTPFYTDHHTYFRQVIREWIESNIVPFSIEWEENGIIPQEIFREFAQQGFTSLSLGKPWDRDTFPQKQQIVCGVNLEGKIDSFYEFIMIDEFTRCVGFTSTCSSLLAANTISLPPIAQFGTQFQKEKFLYPCIQGTKKCCLAITEPWVGSDVANLKTDAKQSDCGKYFIVNGTKKWISGGSEGDFFTTAVRTGEEGMMGISLIIIERGMSGFSIKKMKQQGLWTGGTSFLTFKNVKVPKENLIGQLNEGFKLTMMNFNHERLFIAMLGAGGQKAVIQSCMEYAHKRKTFGKTLIEHPVIRQSIAHIIRLQLNSQSFLENCIYNYDNLKPKQKLQLLPGPLSLLKAHYSVCNEQIFNYASKIFGGLQYTRTGQAQQVEICSRETRSAAILGGSEEIMLDFGIKLSTRMMPNL